MFRVHKVVTRVANQSSFHKHGIAALRMLSSDQHAINIPLSELSNRQVASIFSHLQTGVSSDVLLKERVNGELISLLQTNEELKELGISIPALKFKKLMNNLSQYKTSGVPTQWDAFPVKVVEVLDIPEVFKVLLGSQNYSEECLLKTFQDMKPLLVDDDNIHNLGTSPICTDIVQFLQLSVNPSVIVPDTIVVACLDTALSLAYQKTYLAYVQNRDLFEKCHAEKAVLKILSDSHFVKQPEVVCSASRFYCQIRKGSADEEGITTLLGALEVHKNNESVVNTIFKDLSVLLRDNKFKNTASNKHNFANILHTYMLGNIDNAEFIENAMTCILEYASNREYNSDVGKEINESGLFSLIREKIYPKYCTSPVFLKQFCQMVTSCRNNNPPSVKLMRDKGYSELLTEILDWCSKEEHGMDKEKVKESCLEAVTLLKNY